MPYWSGDNGGATAHGVTRDEIRVASDMVLPNMEAFFNERFEFYGRRIRLIRRNIAGTPAGDRAAARAAHEEDKAFAASSNNDAGFDYYDELARLGIISAGVFPLFSENYLASRRPFLWSYPMANDRLFATAGDWYCARFAGRQAVHAGDPLLRAQERTPGIIFTYRGLRETSPDAMNRELDSCGERAEIAYTPTNGYGNAADRVSFAENAVLQMKTSGVTTLACLCFIVDFGHLMRAATNQAYFPEWLVTTYIWLDQGGAFKLWGSAPPPEQTANMMGLTVQPMHRPYYEHPSEWANPGYYAYGTGENDQQYRTLLLLASGIQMAGPSLTPESFEQGLQQTRFPNPPHRIMAGAVGFEDGDHSMTDDAAEMWWSNTALSPYADERPGAFCYIDHGTRRRIGAFPTDDPFFTGPCDNGSS